jgi:sulfatase maturation enzyme AslB (radical SAM superfamily)
MSRRLLEKNFCTIPWTGFELEPNGDIKNCIISKDVIGNIHKQDIRTIIKSNPVRRQMLNGEYPDTCSGCYLQEKHRKQNFDSISSRIYYTKHLANKISPTLLEDPDNFELRHVDLRWSNACNQACAYCGPLYSSKWAKELGRKQEKNKPGLAKLKEFVFKNIENLENVYMAGGEPMLMKENKEFLDLLYKKNPNATIRINTNLSKTNTGIFDTVCKFKNVHWTISVESIEEEYNYIRHHGKWSDFLENFKIIQRLPHKISINGLYFILNYKSIFDTVKYFQNLGIHNNSFVIGPLYEPLWLNILNLPKNKLEDCKARFKNEVSKKPGFLLQNSYENIISYLTDTKFYANIELTKQELKKMDLRRKIDSAKVFPTLYEEVLN